MAAVCIAPTFETMCADRRGQDRKAYRVAASYSQAGYDRFHTYAIDVSDSGARIVADKNLVKDCFISVQVGSDFRGRARVAWLQPLSAHRVVAGLAFM